MSVSHPHSAAYCRGQRRAAHFSLTNLSWLADTNRNNLAQVENEIERRALGEERRLEEAQQRLELEPRETGLK
jgi:hypothetical protein